MAVCDIPVMVAISNSLSIPKFACILADKSKKLSTVFEEFASESEEIPESTLGPTVKISTSDTGEQRAFNSKITLDQASKMLHSDVLWVVFEFPAQKSVPPPGTRNAFDVLKLAQSTKSSHPAKYSNPVNGTFKLFNRLVDLCKETNVFFR